MFKFVVLFALVAVAAAKPGYLHGGVEAIASPVVAYSAPAVAIPAAVSHQSRVDIISEPVVATYAAHAAPIVSYAAPAVAYGGLGYAGVGVGHGLGLGHGVGLGYGGHLGYAGHLTHGW